MIKDCTTVWSNCLQVIKENIGEQSFKTWFEPIKPISLRDSVLTIQVPSQFFYEWLEEHYVSLLKKVIYHELGSEGRLEYSIIVDRGNDSNKPQTVNIPTKKIPQAVVNSYRPEQNFIKSPFESKTIDRNFLNSQLNGAYTFENYIEGDCNRLARSAGYAVANKPGTTSFNPLMVYGGVGLGKTHLVQAIGNQIKNSNPDKFVLYVSSEKFVNQFIESLKTNNVQDFANFYLLVDILIIDDVQFLSGKEKTQEMFFHIFNHLHQSGKQIVMTSDCPPRDLKGLEERLLSRFKWGLTADLQSPDFETRMAIIQKKMQSDGIDIPDNVVEYLAYSVDTNVRELEGVLISLIAQSSLNRKEIDLELAKQALKHIIEDVETEVNLDFIQKTVAEYFQVSLDSLKAKTRKKEIVTARQVAMYFAKEFTSHSLKSIGYHFGGRDHSTVIHSVQTVSDMIDTDKKFKASIQELQKKFKSKAG
ncbi:chromosomal replication initiator protein DnaA [Pontibacter qinzhouensis]|uniref:Chromosomal replication initiator protein DnaA n=1 Tax=Pontibacter qinzhouensis TaxID=2603253 RepID=A0A5C8KEU9_9BACT|nr:chromosomal replication initiator protein DnaA [Pontibacter qinzhouensis]TXK51561.1 chromosomal replication initiator protein DnaA [Pontibacter qinzhouensis]